MNEREIRALKALEGFGDPACFEQMAQAIRRGSAELICVQDDAVLLRQRNEGFYMIACAPVRLEAILARIPADAEDVMLHGTWPEATVERVRAAMGLTDVEPYVMYAYYGECPPEDTQFDMRPLDAGDLDFVYVNYGHGSYDYVKQRLESGTMIGAYVDGALAGFIGEHAAGAMGLLHVMPEYRRHHLGYALERADLRRTMLAGNTPFCQVDPANEASHRLQERLGLTRSKGRVYWLSGRA